MSTATTAARAAAEWWAEQVGAPTHRLAGDGDVALGEVAMRMVAMKRPVPADCSAFVDALERMYDRLLVAWEGHVALGVDYGPDSELATVGKTHGIHPSRWPAKTIVWACADHVTASLGYGGAVRLVWAAPGWVRPTCHSIAYDELTGRFGEALCGLPLHHDGGHGDWVPDPRRCVGCGLTEGGHHNLPVPGDYHRFRPVGGDGS